jgi:hypothetical protein
MSCNGPAFPVGNLAVGSRRIDEPIQVIAPFKIGHSI